MRYPALRPGPVSSVALAAVLCGLGLWSPAFARGPSGPANFAQDFQSAMKLHYAGQAAEAEKAFRELGARSPTPRGADECLARAAYCALNQKNPDRAMTLAAGIKDDCLSRACRIDILRQQGKPDAILALAGDQDLETWPDRLIFDAALCRGRAYVSKRDAKSAERDFLLAARSTLDPTEKSFAYQFLGDLYRDVLKDPEKALAAYAEAVGAKPAFRRLPEIVTARARLLASSGRGAQAIAELDQLVAAEPKTSSWRCAIQLCYGEVYESLGKRAEALAKYKAAAACPGAPESQLATAKRRIDALENNR